MDTNNLTCTMVAEWVNSSGVTLRKTSLKKANLRLSRNELKAMYLEITAEKTAPIRLQVKGISVHNKFMKEGKACIKFNEVNCTVMLSNAPPGQLQILLRTLFVKMTGEKPTTDKSSLRTQLLNHKPKRFEEISPVTTADLESARRKAVGKSTDTTPSPLSRKRKNSNSTTAEDNKSKAPKRLATAVEDPLNKEQQEVIAACLAGFNVFFTGSAGTGKSYLLRKIICALPPDVTQATASTGVAACHISGVTLHQFAGIGKGDASVERSCEVAGKSAAATANWRKCKHLIIDEISMISGEFFDKVEAVARYIRKSDKPFGGIQVILCGDFFQLPPVPSSSSSSSSQSQQQRPLFAFQSATWSQCVERSFELQQVHRQCDPLFVRVLNSVREGRVTEEVTTTLTGTSRHRLEEDGVVATRLCTHTHDANAINTAKLQALQDVQGAAKTVAAGRTYRAVDSAADNRTKVYLDQLTPVESVLTLKVGAQVMLLKNLRITGGLVNGARGVVTSFRPDSSLPVVQFLGGATNGGVVIDRERFLVGGWSGRGDSGALSRLQIPLKLAWAFSVHKSQGLTLDCVEMSLGRVFEAGQAYVALSRARSLHSLRVVDFKANQVWANPDVLTFYRRLRRHLEDSRLYALGDNSNNTHPKTTDKTIAKPRQRVVNKRLFEGKPLVTIS